MGNTIPAVFFGIIAVITLVGNVIVVVVFIKKRKWLKKVHSCLLLALAIQDIFTAICLLLLPQFVLPSDVYEVPSKPNVRQLFCSIIWAPHIPFALSIASIYTCLMLAIDRWFAVFRPMSYKRFSTSKKAIVITLISPWIAGFGFEAGTAMQSHVNVENGSYSCSMDVLIDTPKNTTTVLLLLFGKGAFPALIMVIAYGQMVLKLRKSSRVLRASRANGVFQSPYCKSGQNASHSSLKRLTIMVCAASVSVVVCWLPDQLYFSLSELDLIKVDNSTHNWLHILAFINTCLNPFLYSFSNKQYKKEFETIFCSNIFRRARRQPDEARSRHLPVEREPRS